MPEPARPLGTDDADDLRLYLEAAAREPLLTKEEEVELAIIIEHGKESEDKLRAGRLRSEKSILKARQAVKKAEAARQRFIMANLRLVVSVARKYQGQGLPLLDLIQFPQTMGREPSRDELAKALDTTVEEIDDLSEMGRREPLSLQSPVGEDTELGDLIEEVDSDAAFNEVEDALLREEIGDAVERVLDEREGLRKLRDSNLISTVAL